MQTVQAKSEEERRQPHAGCSPRVDWIDAIAKFVQSPLFSYATMVVLVLRVLWGMWDFKDLDWGDTISYYTNACQTFDRGRINIVWSPLFAIFGALVLHVSHQPYFYCIATRVLCDLAMVLLTLAVTRRILPAGVAWFVTAWWALLPIGFNTLYQIHLFGALPILATWLILLRDPESRWRRGIALAIMVGAGLLIRNEHLAYGVLFGTVVMGAEFFNRQNHPKFGGTSWFKQVLVPYLVPLAAVALLVSGCYLRSTIRHPQFSAVMRYRHTNNVGQIYAFGFAQRHPNMWDKDPWQGYGELMTKDFGAPELSMTEAFFRNPAAATEHLMWNVGLIPSGLQLMLFNRTAGGPTPDYIKPISDPCVANNLSIAVLLIILSGLLRVFRDRKQLASFVEQRRWALAAAACYSLVALFVMVTQRPRASYVFPFAIEIMTLVGFCIWRIYSSPTVRAVAAKAFPIAAVAAIVLVQPFYPTQKDPRTLLGYVELLRPLRLVIEYDRGNVIIPKYCHEVAHYLYDSNESFEKRFMYPNQVPQLYAPNADQLQVLKQNSIRDILFDEPTAVGPSKLEQAVAHAPGWRLLALKKLPDRTLSMYSMSKLYDAKNSIGVDTLQNSWSSDVTEAPNSAEAASITAVRAKADVANSANMPVPQAVTK